MSTIKRAFPIAVLLCACLGCQDNEIVAYKIPKEKVAAPQAPAAQMMGGGAEAMASQAGALPPDNAASPDDISWDIPEGWIEQPPSAMRIGSFLVNGANGQKADISVIPLSGPAGGMLANVNRWLGQIGLPPVDDAKLGKLVSRRKLGAHEFSLMILGENEASAAKIISAAILEDGGRTWFVKMMGDREVVKAAQPAFEKFLGSIKVVTE